MSQFDFPSAVKPSAAPLRPSHEENPVEAELKGLFLELFEHVAADTFDASVMGSPHLGSFDLVRRMVNHDGLALFPGAGEEAATRYLYRAWKSGDVQKRGLHFLRTYLQLLLPNLCEVNQLWHRVDKPYPTALFAADRLPDPRLYQIGEPGLRLDGSWGVGRPITDPAVIAERTESRRPDTDSMWLTSRIEIALDLGVEVRSISRLLPIIRAVIPARLVPLFVFKLGMILDMPVRVDVGLDLQKGVELRYPWPGRIITDALDARWALGRDGEATRLPAPFGSFKVGQMLGGVPGGALRNERIQFDTLVEKHIEADFWPVESLPKDPPQEYGLTPAPTKLGKRPRSLDGTWTLGGALKIGRFRLDGAKLRARKMIESARFGAFKLYPEQTAVPLPTKPARLTLSGNWKLGGRANPEFEIEIIKESVDG